MDARKIAEEALALAEKATPGPWHVSGTFDIECDTCGEHPYVCDLTAEHEDGTAYQSLSMQFCGLESLAAPNAALVAHAGTHYATLARAYLALLPPAGAWSHDEGDVVLTHPDGSTERFYAGERAPFIVAACSRYEALVSDLPHAVETCGCPVLRAWPAAHTEAVERLRALGGGSP